MTYTCVTLAERPELEAEMPRLHSESWPEFLLNDPVALHYWGSLFTVFADFQYVLCDESGNALAAGHKIPFTWDGTVEGLPVGWDAVLKQGLPITNKAVLPPLCAAFQSWSRQGSRARA